MGVVLEGPCDWSGNGAMGFTVVGAEDRGMNSSSTAEVEGCKNLRFLLMTRPEPDNFTM